MSQGTTLSPEVHDWALRFFGARVTNAPICASLLIKAHAKSIEIGPDADDAVRFLAAKVNEDLDSAGPMLLDFRCR